ncbi:MAG: sulfotransferase family 2 domain-containing protein, partial [Planctomycetales bacterium]|nr:sulfotransferase family 2 domain-containing protein [Planctomycetales bacterium]
MHAFIHIPKTAGTAVRHMLRSAFGPRHCDIKVPVSRRDTHPWVTEQDLQFARRVYPRLESICGHRLVCSSNLETSFPTIRYFTFLRDPVERFISHFHHFHRGRTEACCEEDVLAYARQPAHRNVQTRWICGEEDAHLAIHTLETRIRRVGIKEEYAKSLMLLRHWLKLPTSAICPAVRNPAKGKANLPF